MGIGWYDEIAWKNDSTLLQTRKESYFNSLVKLEETEIYLKSNGDIVLGDTHKMIHLSEEEKQRLLKQKEDSFYRTTKP